MSQLEAQADHAEVYFVVGLVAFIPITLLLPWVALAVPGFAYATPVRRHRRMLIALWVVGGVISALLVIFLLGSLLGTSSIHDGPSHRVN
jgi:cytochrome bd-type quinol oxidase subunit 2